MIKELGCANEIKKEKAADKFTAMLENTTYEFSELETRINQLLNRYSITFPVCDSEKTSVLESAPEYFDTLRNYTLKINQGIRRLHEFLDSCEL